MTWEYVVYCDDNLCPYREIFDSWDQASHAQNKHAKETKHHTYLEKMVE